MDVKNSFSGAVRIFSDSNDPLERMYNKCKIEKSYGTLTTLKATTTQNFSNFLRDIDLFK